jgi:sulfate/thiosulfate transport system ATP-binding protein
MSIEVNNISKTFGTFVALRNVNLRVAGGELVALLGPSGSGKTTLLRIISGLEIPDPGSGTIRFHEEDVAARSVGERKVGFVFQHYALFRHLTVFENVAFGLRVLPRRQRPSRAEIHDRVSHLLGLVQLDALANRYPSQLSGGQRQRVALARALAVQPKVLLLDEPFGSLDAKVRLELRQWLRRLHDEIHLTSMFVTHDQEEALEVADRIVVMNNGQIEQIGTPTEVFHNPATEFVMHFLGSVNLFHGRVEHGKAYFGPLEMEYPAHQSASYEAKLFVRPHDFAVSLNPPGESHFKARVMRINAAGPQVKMVLWSDFGQRVDIEITQERFAELRPAVGSEVFVSPRRIKAFMEDYAI